MKRIVLAAIAVAVAAALPAAAEVENYTVDPNHTFPSYEIGHFGYSFQRGRFNKTAGKITLDFAAKKRTADITMDAASVSTGAAKLDQHLHAADSVDVGRHPPPACRAH